MDDITSSIKSATDSGVALKPRSTVKGIAYPNKTTGKYDEPVLPSKDGVDPVIARPRDDNYTGLKKALGVDNNATIKPMKKGGKVVKCPYDGIAERGKTRAKLK
jgi:hypothetical protein